MKPKAITVLSGGLDSTVATSIYAKNYDIHALTFDYGQHSLKKELESSKAICEKLNMNQSVIKLDWLKKISNSTLTTDKPLPKLGDDKLNDKKTCDDTAKSVWVPGRNTVFTSIALSYAESIDASIIIVGWDYEEAVTFPDNSKEYLNSFNLLIANGSFQNIEVKAPLIDMDKTEIVKTGYKLDAPMDLSYSCYEGDDNHCGICESCLRRKRAFKQANIEDPTKYNI